MALSEFRAISTSLKSLSNFTLRKYDDNRIWCFLLLKSMFMVSHVMRFILMQAGIVPDS